MRQSTKRLASLGGVLVLLLAALITYLNFTSPSYQAAQDIKSQMLSRSNLVETQKAAIAQVEKLINQSAAEDQLKQVVALALPPSKDESDVIHQLNTLGTVNHLSIQSMVAVSQTREPPASVARATSTIDLVKPQSTVGVQVRLAGSYEDFKTFLKNIETNVRIFDVKTISIDPLGKPNQDTYSFDLTVATYYQAQ